MMLLIMLTRLLSHRDEEIARRVATEAVEEFGSDPDFIRRSQEESERKAQEKAEQEQRSVTKT
jgi:hypothetical protein